MPSRKSSAIGFLASGGFCQKLALHFPGDSCKKTQVLAVYCPSHMLACWLAQGFNALHPTNSTSRARSRKGIPDGHSPIMVKTSLLHSEDSEFDSPRAHSLRSWSRGFEPRLEICRVAALHLRGPTLIRSWSRGFACRRNHANRLRG